MDKLNVKLENLVNNGVIQEVDEPTDWVSQMTNTLKKNNDIVVCLESQALNRALKTERHAIHQRLMIRCLS